MTNPANDSDVVTLKLQRPLVHGTMEPHPRGAIMAYTEGHGVVLFLPQSPMLLGLFGDKLKIYVTARLLAEGIDISTVLEDQPW